jgi:flagellar motility protein MotE (MotC chaperone)
MADGTPGEKEGEPRRSFLANLLDLPPLDPENVKREEIARYLNLAEMKKEQVDTRLGLLKERELQLMKLEDSIENKIQKLEEERAFLAETLQKEKDVQAERLKHLVELYRKMEPKKAAPVFEGMHRDLAVGLFKLIEQKQITKILEAMSPAKAVELSEYFSRIRSAREYDVLKDVNQSLKAEFEECKGMQAH